MMKQIEVHGQRVELYSPDKGHTWSSSPQSIVAYERRKKMLRLELQNSFARIDDMRDLDPDNFSELDTPKSLTKAKEKNHAHNTTVSQRHDLINIAATDTSQPHETTAWRFAKVKERRTTMDGKKEQIKGRIKEAAGVLTDNDRLKREGKLDQAVGKVQEKAEKTMDKIKDALTEQKTSQEGGMMSMGRQGERRGDRIARSVKLLLLPCLCDLNELATGKHNVRAR